MFEVLLASGAVIKAPVVSLNTGGVLYVYDVDNAGGRVNRRVLSPAAWLSYRELRAVD